MKNSITVLVLAVALFAVQACARKSEKAEEVEITATAPAAAVPTPAERRIANEKKRAVLAEKRKLEWEARIKTTPTFKDKNGILVYNKAETDPSYNGGQAAMDQYLRDNIKYPEDAAQEGLEGTVYVDFVVQPDGTVRDVTAATIPDESVDRRFVDEAVRVVSAMPKWVPGRQKGKPVAAAFSVPVTFELAE